MNGRLSLLWRNIRRWEFWPFWLFYTPVYIQLLLRGLWSGRLAGFACANPAVPFGGLLEYSKWDLLKPLPEAFVPKTVLFPVRTPAPDVDRLRTEAGIAYPVYVKPDRGERGLLVEKVRNQAELEVYLDSCGLFADRLEDAGRDPSAEVLLLQAAAPGDVEFGVLYSRHPEEQTGTISSIVRKDLISVTGDGNRSLGDLIDMGERTRLHRIGLRQEFASRLANVPDAGETVRLVEVGNHIRGATFLDATNLADSRLAEIFGRLAGTIPGFYIGRFDVRCDSAESLASGDFQVIEVNAVNSEPAHIYDPSNSLFKAYRDLLRHWRRVHSIARANIKLGCEPPRARELFAAISRHAKRRGLAR